MAKYGNFSLRALFFDIFEVDFRINRQTAGKGYKESENVITGTVFKCYTVIM